MKKFDKHKNKIVIVHYGNVMHYPPVLNLLDCLVSNSINVTLISENTEDIPARILESEYLYVIDIVPKEGNTIYHAVKRTIKRRNDYKTAFLDEMNDGDIVWTTNDNAVAVLNKALVPYSKVHVLQLMELVNKCPLIKGLPYFTFPIDKYARNAWKTVVPERNRAYIQKVLWKQDKVPYVLPNIPYRLDPGEIDEEVQKAIDILKNEKRKIVLYLGVVGKDRNLGCFADAIDSLGEDYCLYVIGRIVNTVAEDFNKLLAEHKNVKYLGFFTPPSHLHFIKYAYIALLPYKPSYNIKSQSPLNALYCAPNKIFEYAGFGVPMVGSDVLGLKEPFERYNIGKCCDENSVESIKQALQQVAADHDEMGKNCIDYYKMVDYDEIVSRILGLKEKENVATC